MFGSLGVVSAQDVVSAQQCVPSCRTGFVCIAGNCVSQCNPPCPDSETCTADLQCVPKAPVRTAEDVERDEREAALDATMRHRQAMRLRHRLFVYAGGGMRVRIGDLGADVTINHFGFGGAFGAAYRKHFKPKFGIDVRLEISPGARMIAVSRTTSSSCRFSSCDESATKFDGAWIDTTGEFGLTLGPFGRFHIGPSVFLAAAVLTGGDEVLIEGSDFNVRDPESRNTSQGSGRDVTVGALNNQLLTGVGFNLGLFFGPDEQVEATVRTKAGFAYLSDGSHVYLSVQLVLGYAVGAW